MRLGDAANMNCRIAPYGIGEIPGFGALSWAFFVYLYAPIAILVIFSFNETRSATVWSGFSLDWYARAFANDDIQRAAYNSLVVAVSATGIATSIAVVAAHGKFVLIVGVESCASSTRRRAFIAALSHVRRRISP